MSAVSSVIAGADDVRRRVIVPVARFAPALLLSRATRIAALGTALVTLTLFTAGLFPAWSLVLGPLLLGVPHVLADVRYLVLRPGLHRRGAIAVPIVLGFALAAAFGVRGAFVGAAGAVLLSRAPVRRKAVLIGLAATLFVLASLAGRIADVAFAHAHNLIALAFFCVWRKRSSLRWLWPVGAFVVGAIAIAGGAFDHATLASSLGSFDLTLARRALAPRLAPELGARLVLLFAFAQSVHYVVWLGFVPAESRTRETPPSIGQALRAIVRELGPAILAIAGVTALVFLVGTTLDVARARDGYLAAASFHGWLEIAVGFLFLAERRRPG